MWWVHNLYKNSYKWETISLWSVWKILFTELKGNLKHLTLIQGRNCQNCFSGVEHLKKHMRMHTGDKSYPCDQWVLCDQCKNIFSVWTSKETYKNIYRGEIIPLWPVWKILLSVWTSEETLFSVAEDLNKLIRTHTLIQGRNYIPAINVKNHFLWKELWRNIYGSCICICKNSYRGETTPNGRRLGSNGRWVGSEGRGPESDGRLTVGVHLLSNKLEHYLGE